MPGVLERTLQHLAGTLERAEHGRGNFRVDPRVELVGALLLTIAAVSCRRVEIATLLLVIVTAAGMATGITWQRLLVAWAGGLFFAALIALPAVFTSGWRIAALLILRSETSLTIWLVVVMTTPFNHLLRAMRALRMPMVVVAILSMTFRYIFLLVETTQDMLLSKRSRIVGRLSGLDNRRMLVATAGVLMSKSIQLGDEVHHAMAARGFRGEVHILEDFATNLRDWVILGLVLTLAIVVILLSAR